MYDNEKMSDFKIEDADLYEILGIESTSSTADIKKAYRKKALECHPDKNPDNPNAAALFHKLSKVLEILSDESARKAYDKVLNGKKAAALRHRELDSKRKKLKEDLEYREKFANTTCKTKTDDQLLQDEIERLRKEGSRHLQEEMEYVNQLIKESQIKCDANDEWDSAKYRIKIKWNADKNDETNGGYSQELLHKFLSKYGDINVMVMSPKKKGSALVEFKARSGAEMAINLEQGLSVNPLKLEWVNGPPSSNKRPNSSNLIKDTDFESLVLHKMRQAEERKRLIQQMLTEDQEENS